jgi:predicted RNase H-like HicB family nuclease
MMAAGNIDEVVFIVQEDREDGGYSAVCHPYGIFTQGEDLDDLRAMVIDAVAGRFADEPVKPGRIRLHFVRDEVVA